jgi:hypothetical protein
MFASSAMVFVSIFNLSILLEPYSFRRKIEEAEFELRDFIV